MIAGVVEKLSQISTSMTSIQKLVHLKKIL